jgi:hypothetical protein
VADPNQTPARGDWACPCSGCQKAVAWERKQLIQALVDYDIWYLKYRGSSFDSITGELLWAKDDAEAFHEGIQYAIKLIEDRAPKPKARK